ncbi:hypothetical protein GIB67_014094 [Kingdonia uniflora]|uniref:Pentatricopeptide repeat-containing protein n=1 Tax=Kingdonia uniflora TaxID=39325 RepID=A0A7J7KXC8_9MAGN|nr:hypothetical protein GIB67_014094 [Kingdonia uniflora]
MYLNCKNYGYVVEILREFNGFDLVVWICFVSNHVKEGNLDEGRCLFDEMPEWSEVTWSTMIVGFMREGRVEESIGYYEKNPFQDVIT